MLDINLLYFEYHQYINNNITKLLDVVPVISVVTIKSLSNIFC